MLWVTRRLLLTYSPEDYRYHARFAVFGYPTLFSVLGLSYAPAPSLESSLFARALAAKGLAPSAIAAQVDREYADERIDIDDPATVTRAAASAPLQASARAAGGEAFCTTASCRLFNPHRKPEVVRSMVEGKLCAAHTAFFRRRGAAS